jgi:tetratricopeptide (TPR) repeat protein
MLPLMKFQFVYPEIFKHVVNTLKCLLLGLSIILTLGVNAQSSFIKTNLSMGDSMLNENNYAQAVKYYSRVIDSSVTKEINDIQILAFAYRGAAKYQLNDLHGAIQDFTKAIELANRNDVKPIGIHRLDLPEFIEEMLAFAFFNRGCCKHDLGLREGACIDLRRASELGNETAFELISKNCNY